MKTKIISCVNTTELNDHLQNINSEMMQVIRTSEFVNMGSKFGWCADYIVIYK